MMLCTVTIATFHKMYLPEVVMAVVDFKFGPIYILINLEIIVNIKGITSSIPVL